MHQIGVYRRTKPAHDGLKTAKKPERYREAFHADLTLYEAAVRYFRERGLKKLPAASRLQAENEALISDKNGLYTEYREQKARAAELQKVKSNLATMLRQERTKRCAGIGSGKGVPFCSPPTRKGVSILHTPLLWEVDR